MRKLKEHIRGWLLPLPHAKCHLPSLTNFKEFLWLGIRVLRQYFTTLIILGCGKTLLSVPLQRKLIGKYLLWISKNYSRNWNIFQIKNKISLEVKYPRSVGGRCRSEHLGPSVPLPGANWNKSKIALRGWLKDDKFNGGGPIGFEILRLRNHLSVHIDEDTVYTKQV